MTDDTPGRPVSERLEDWVPRVYRFAMRLTGDSHIAEDLTQETFLRAWRKHSGLHDPMAVRSWLFSIAANLWRDAMRRERSAAARAEPLVEVAGRNDDLAANRDEVEHALAAMNALPTRQRTVVYLAACEEMNIAEIAALLGISTTAVKASLSLGRKALREKVATEVVRRPL